MRTNPNPIPYGQGVYVLAHEKSKSIYVGSSTNLRARMHEWRSAFRRGDVRVRRFPNQIVEEYEFRVLKRTEGMTLNELHELEEKIIAQARKGNVNILNVKKPVVSLVFELDGILGSATFHLSRHGKNSTIGLEKLKRGWTIEQVLGREPAPPPRQEDPAIIRQRTIEQMPTKIMTPNGPVTYNEAAQITGRTRDNIRSNMNRLRKSNPGVAQINIETLMP